MTSSSRPAGSSRTDGDGAAEGRRAKRAHRWPCEADGAEGRKRRPLRPLPPPRQRRPTTATTTDAGADVAAAGVR